MIAKCSQKRKKSNHRKEDELFLPVQVGHGGYKKKKGKYAYKECSLPEKVHTLPAPVWRAIDPFAGYTADFCYPGYPAKEFWSKKRNRMF